MLVAQRFHIYCKSQGIDPGQDKLPYGFVQKFIADSIIWKTKQRSAHHKQIRLWYKTWLKAPSNEMAVVLGEPEKGSTRGLMNQLKSRAPVKSWQRQRAPGGGRPFKAPLLRQALYEWWSGIRYAIDWGALITSRRSRGKNTWPVFLARPCVSECTNCSKTLPTHAC